MVQSPNKSLTLEEFLALSEGDVTSEFFNGEAVPKYKNNEMSAVAITGGSPATRCLPKFFHSRFQKTKVFKAKL
jgi:hypothetical protein